jgi:hypothetical protein
VEGQVECQGPQQVSVAQRRAEAKVPELGSRVVIAGAGPHWLKGRLWSGCQREGQASPCKSTRCYLKTS